MKTVLVILALLVAGFLIYRYTPGEIAENAKLPTITDPWYAEVRATNDSNGREIDVAMFARAIDEADCRNGSKAGFTNIRKACPTCVAQEPKCSKELPPRYARMFDDEPISSAYLSAHSGSIRERDVRLVVYGLTDEEGMNVCEILRTELSRNYVGPTQCIAPRN
ncbi:MAG TPA: hypothetical protein VMF52_08870 [Steroidobacteraceae bacterium]|nr:hypothetical protein [Steroidobacteraceae bacterium]